MRALVQSMARELCPQGILSPDSIAAAYWQIHPQPRDTWTFEPELQPWLECW